MNTNELAELLQQREDLEKRINELRIAQREEAIQTVREIIQTHNLTADDCGFRGAARVQSKAPAARQTVAPKYVGPNGDTWSGRGRAPRWLADLEAQGRSRTEFAV